MDLFQQMLDKTKKIIYDCLIKKAVTCTIIMVK